MAKRLFIVVGETVSGALQPVYVGRDSGEIPAAKKKALAKSKERIDRFLTWKNPQGARKDAVAPEPVQLAMPPG